MKMKIQFNMQYIVGFLKKYLSLIIPGVLLLVALIFIILTPVVGGSVQESVKKSYQQAQTVQRLSQNVPSADQFQVEQRYQDQLENDIQQALDLVQLDTLRTLVSYRIFPEPVDTSQQVFMEFGQSYREEIERLVREMNALDAPSESDIRKATSRQGSSRDFVRSTSSSGQTEAKINAECTRRSTEISVYAHPALFPWYDYWEDFEFIGTTSAVEDCWYSQMSLWIYEDIVDTIKAMNADSQQVSSSPVKRLMEIGFSAVSRVGSSSRSAVAAEPFEYVTMKGLGPMGAETWTGRISNDDIDVVHFRIAVILSPEQILPFMAELCSAKQHQYRPGWDKDAPLQTAQHNQITVLEYSHEPIVPQEGDHLYYRYGDKTVVRLELICEYLFGKEGYKDIQPESIQKLLGGGEEESERSSRRR